MGTTSARRAPLMLLVAVVALMGVACDVAWERPGGSLLGSDDTAVTQALRALVEDTLADEVAGVTIEAAADAPDRPQQGDASASLSRGLLNGLRLAPADDGNNERDPAPPQRASLPASSTGTSVAAAPSSASSAGTSVVAAPSSVSSAGTSVVPAPSSVPPSQPTATAVPTAVAVTVPQPTVAPSPPTYGERGRAALAMLRFDPAELGYTVSFLPGRDGYLGLTYTTDRRIEVYVRPSMSTAQVAYIIGHEVGHAIDHIRNSNADRARWMAARGIPAATAWWPTGIGSDLATPAGDFAECFASWAVGSASHSVWGACAGQMGLMGELVAG